MGSLADDRHGFRGHTRLKVQVDGDAVLNIDLHRAGYALLEARFLDRDLVTANAQRAGDVFSIVVGGERQHRAAIDISNGDFCARDHRTA